MIHALNVNKTPSFSRVDESKNVARSLTFCEDSLYIYIRLESINMAALEELPTDSPSLRRPRSSLEPSSPSDNAYPEGGRKAWLAVLGVWCALIPSAGFLNSLGALQVWTSSHQD